MIRNYFKTAWRNLVRGRGFSFINIFGLSLGMSVALLIGLWIWDELTFNQYHDNYAKVGRIMQNQTINGEVYTGEALPIPLDGELRSNYADNFKYLAMASWQGDYIVSKEKDHQSKNGIFIDKDGPKIFSLKMVKGSLDGLDNPNSILLSESAAKAFFKDKDPMGQLLKINSNLDVKVTGIFQDLPYNTLFRELEFMAPWDLYLTSEPWLQWSKTQWSNNSFQGFAQISDNSDFATVNKNIRQAKLNRVSDGEKKFNAEIFLHPMDNWHLKNVWKDGMQLEGQGKYVKMFSIIGVFVLLLACINFMNLNTARSEKRAKEVGIRKTVGSARYQIVLQFFCESILVALLAYCIAILFVSVSLPWFNEVAKKQIIVPWSNLTFWAAGLVFTIFTGLLAGSYPAFFLSSFDPVKVLKGTYKMSKLASLPRKVMVVGQFTVSIALMIGTVIVYQQIQHSKNRPVGYDRNGLVMVEMKTSDFYGKFDVLRSELKKRGAITEMAESSSPLTGVWSNSSGFDWEGKDPNLDTDFASFWVTHEFGKTVDFKMAEGRDFSRDFATDSNAVILNEAAVEFMKIKDPVGKTITWSQGREGQPLTIIGVVKNMVAVSPFAPVKQAVYVLDYYNVNWLNFRLNPNRSTKESLEIIQEVFKKVIPSAPFDYLFADQEYAEKFAQEERIGKLSAIFAILAIFISCLGLFGLASFVAEQRTKEIGIRKIVGASVFSLWRLLSGNFVGLVSISCLIAAPLAYYYLNTWLQGYSYRIKIEWWVFVVSGLGALIITLLTVSYHAIKAARANPVKSLRTE